MSNDSNEYFPCHLNLKHKINLFILDLLYNKKIQAESVDGTSIVFKFSDNSFGNFTIFNI